MATKKSAEKVTKTNAVASATSATNVTRAAKISKPSLFVTKGSLWEAMGFILSTISAPSTIPLTEGNTVIAH